MHEMRKYPQKSIAYCKQMVNARRFSSYTCLWVKKQKKVKIKSWNQFVRHQAKASFTTSSHSWQSFAN